MTFSSAIKRAITVCERWGIDVVRVDDLEDLPENVYSGPRHASLCWPNGPIAIHTPTPERYPDEVATDIIHELGHLLVGGKKIQYQQELTGPGLALDHANCKAARLSWSILMQDFTTVDDGSHWPRISTAKRGQYLKKSRAKAVKAGLLGKDGRPTYIRRGS